MKSLLLITIFGAIYLKDSFGKPMEKMVMINSDVLDLVASTINNTSEIG